MELRDVELLKNRIDNAFHVNEGRGISIHLSREETLLVKNLLNKEISIRRLTELPQEKKMGVPLNEFLEGKK